MGEEEGELFDLVVEFSDENGKISTVDLPEVQLAVTLLTIHIKAQGSGKKTPKLDILIDRDDEGKPYFIISNSKSAEVEL